MKPDKAKEHISPLLNKTQKIMGQHTNPVMEKAQLKLRARVF